MTPVEINQRISDVIGEGDLHFVVKRGYFYRPGGAGYTSNPDDAWRLPLAKAKEHEYRHGDEPVTLRKCPPRDFHGSLDAMRVAEDWVVAQSGDSKDADALRYQYALQLYSAVPQIQQPILATAAQRAEAFLRVLNLWED